MSLRKKGQIKSKQALKRRKARLKLLQRGLNPDDFFTGKYYLASEHSR